MAEPDRILVVEDDPFGLRFLVDVLEHAGYRVDAECDARQAVARVSENRYGLVVSDVVMPHMAGTALIAQLSRSQPDLPALLVSAFPDEPTRAEARALGVPLLAKPFRAETLIALVKDLLAATRVRRAAP